MSAPTRNTPAPNREAAPARARQSHDAVARAALAYGGDWNPEQWDAATMDQDITLMQEAGVTLISLAIFSWARLEPVEGTYDLDWLVNLVDRLYEAGINVDLATGTASPPAWMATDYPDSLPVDANGVRLGFGSRQQYCPSSRAYRERSRALAGELARRLGDHPAVVLWHIGNEYGCHVHECFCDTCAQEFRTWLTSRHGDVAGLNRAWGTDFWSQRYGSVEQVTPPAAAPTFLNPAQLLDWRRFSDHQLLGCLTGEIEEIRAHSSVPITTNFMGALPWLDYRQWARHLDLISDDSYPDPGDPGAAAEIAWTGDLMRGLGDGAPWLLMEQAPGAVQWRERNATKRPGQFALWSLARLAHGADGVLQFQWRQSVRGAEAFHAAMVPHAGLATRAWREVLALGADLRRLAPVIGTRVVADVAVIVDWEWEWARAATVGPVNGDRTFAAARQWHRSLWEAGVAVDVVGPEADLSLYKVVVVPEPLVDEPGLTARLTDAAWRGTNVVITGPAGIVDTELSAVLGGYLGSLQDLLGVRVLEHTTAGVMADTPYPAVAERGEAAFRISRAVRTPGTESWFGLRPVTQHLATSTDLRGGGWAEIVGARSSHGAPYVGPPAPDLSTPGRVGDAEVVAVFDGRGAGYDLEGLPAITRRAVGAGAAWYLATDLDAPGRAELLTSIMALSGVTPVLPGLGDGVEAVRRGQFLFLLNHGDTSTLIEGVQGTDLLTGERVNGRLSLAARSSAVVDDGD